MTDPYLQIENLSFSYPAQGEGEAAPVLHGLNLQIERGSFVAVLGRNGSGKSTLAKLLGMILTPTSGKIRMGGKEITDPALTEDELFALRAGVGMVFQNPDNQLVATIVEEDIAFGPENLGLAPEQIRARVDSALDTVGMRAYAKHAPHQLSGGQKQRIAIAGVIAMRPECILFDESTAMLDPTGRAEVMQTVLALNKEGITEIFITHNMNEAVLADRVLVMDEGRIVLDGTPKEVFAQADTLRGCGLGVPQVTELFEVLRQQGLPVGEPVISEEEGAERLYALLNQ